MRHSANSHAAFLHGFKQRTLRLGCGAIYFIGQKNLREDGPLAKLKVAAVLAFDHDRCSSDIGGHKVGGELNAAKFQLQRMTERANEKRFSQSWNAFKQYMAARKQGDKHAIHNIGLANNYFEHFGFHPREIIAKHFDGALRILGITHGRIIGENKCRFCMIMRLRNCFFNPRF